MGRRHPSLTSNSGGEFLHTTKQIWDGTSSLTWRAPLAMCGRVRSTLGADQVAAASGGAAWKTRPVRARYNASPGASLAVIRRAESGESTSDRVVETMRFGLVPSFTDPGAKVDFYRMFNARSETIAEKGVFSRLLQRRRGVVLINGFYEWAAERAGSSQVKQPYYLHLEGKGGGSEGDVLRCAALYDRWKGGTGGELVTVTIITVEASEPLRWLHDRMPAVLRTDEDVCSRVRRPTVERPEAVRRGGHEVVPGDDQDKQRGLRGSVVLRADEEGGGEGRGERRKVILGCGQTRLTREG